MATNRHAQKCMQCVRSDGGSGFKSTCRHNNVLPDETSPAEVCAEPHVVAAWGRLEKRSHPWVAVGFGVNAIDDGGGELEDLVADGAAAGDGNEQVAEQRRKENKAAGVIIGRSAKEILGDGGIPDVRLLVRAFIRLGQLAIGGVCSGGGQGSHHAHGS